MYKALAILPAALFLLAFNSYSDLDIKEDTSFDTEYEADQHYYGSEIIELPMDAPQSNIPQDLLNQLEEPGTQEKI